MHILIAEKNPHGRRMLSRILKMAGYEVSVAESGNHAMSLLQEAGPDVVLMNVFQCMRSSDAVQAGKITINPYEEAKPAMLVTCGPGCDDLSEFMVPKNQHCDGAFDLLPIKVKSEIMDKIQQLCSALRQCNRMSSPEAGFSWEYFNRLMDKSPALQC